MARSDAIPNTYRFFVPPEAIQDTTITLEDRELAHQLSRVLRLRPGDRVLLLDGQGNACVVVLTELGRERVCGQVERREAAQGEPSVTLTLYVPLLRPERLEWVLQKGTELGVRRFVLVRWSHALPAEQANERKLTRWQRIIREAAEQACRGCLPELVPPVTLSEACADAATADLALILWEGSEQQSGAPTPALRSILRAFPPDGHLSSVAVFSGPEGGITPEELTTATGHGIIPVSLGPRILRAETAPIATSAAIFYELG